jgi:hypothetical protein
MQFPKEIIAKSSPRTETGIMSQRVALYEELNGRMIVHREGSPRAFPVIDCVPGGFTTDAAQLAALEAGAAEALSEPPATDLISRSSPAGA